MIMRPKEKPVGSKYSLIECCNYARQNHSAKFHYPTGECYLAFDRKQMKLCWYSKKIGIPLREVHCTTTDPSHKIKKYIPYGGWDNVVI